MIEKTKQSSENLDYDFYFFEHFPSGDNISSVVVSATPIGLTLSPSASINNQIVKQFISGGSDGMRYKVTCTATSGAGRIKELEFYLTIDNT